MTMTDSSCRKTDNGSVLSHTGRHVITSTDSFTCNAHSSSSNEHPQQQHVIRPLQTLMSAMCAKNLPVYSVLTCTDSLHLRFRPLYMYGVGKNCTPIFFTLMVLVTISM